MKFLRWLLLALVMALVALVALLFAANSAEDKTIVFNGDSEGTSTSGAGSAAFSDDVDTTASLGPSLASPPVPASTRPASMLQLADGDSFDILWGDTGEFDEVRLFGINAPEGNACFGQDAREVLRILSADQELQIETIQRDEFGRVLANVWVDELFVNATLVELGAALVLSDGGSHASLIAAAQDVAKSQGAGLWDPAECGADQSVALRIGWIEANAPGPDNENKNGEWIEIDNDGSTAADLTDWSIRDESTRHRYSFPDGFMLDAGATVRVFSGCGDDRNDELYWCDADPVWNNGGDTGFLVDPDGRFADTRSYDG